MPSRPCPNCQSSGPRHLEASSRDGYVNYYRCDGCGHVWTVTKDAAEQIRHVTPLTPPSPPQQTNS